MNQRYLKTSICTVSHEAKQGVFKQKKVIYVGLPVLVKTRILYYPPRCFAVSLIHLEASHLFEEPKF